MIFGPSSFQNNNQFIITFCILHGDYKAICLAYIHLWNNFTKGLIEGFCGSFILDILGVTIYSKKEETNFLFQHRNKTCHSSP